MSEKPSAIPTSLRVLGWVLLLGLLAGLLSCAAAYGIIGKWFVTWRTLPTLPENAKTIGGATFSTVDVETQSGRFLRCDLEKDGRCWIPVDAPVTETDPGCRPYDRTRLPGNLIDQRLVCKNYADGGDTAVYALRRDGKVLAWRAGDSGYEVLLLLLFPAVCAPLGLVLGLVIGLLRNRKSVFNRRT